MSEILWRKGRELDQGKYPGFRPESRVEDGIRIDRDVAVAMRDGVKIYADIYRPALADPKARVLPAIVAWSPYGKHQTGPGGFDRFANRTCVPPGVPGKWTKFEAPDPEYWCQHGYAVINPDGRGSWMSEGDLLTIGGSGAQGGEALDMYDLIEWLAEQPWCNGKVALSGNSWLAQCQWYAAATRPPHLAAIAPWEGWSDLYRENVALGGITTAPSNWIDFVWDGLHSRARVEDCPAMAAQYPTWNEYWEEKRAKHELTQCPAYVVASWNSRLHSRGSFEGFKQLGSKHKWLRIHDGWEWPDYYDPANVEDLRKFFDHYLKGIDNGWEKTPRVRIAIMDRAIDAPTNAYRAENQWPLARTRHQPLYLDATSARMSRSLVADESSIVYQATEGSAFFDIRFDEDTELTGQMSLRLWVEARGNDDLDLFVVAQKLDSDGKRVPYTVYGVNWVAEPARGFLRVSHRELDPERSQPGQPWHTHRIEQLLKPGEIVPVDIEFWPMGCLWHAGQTLRILIAGHPILHVGNPVTGESLVSARNKGEHVIWTGGRYDSHLLIPNTPKT
ncbi:MAG: CocE/NonD family hydrolase [Burkholderiales bacterium]